MTNEIDIAWAAGFLEGEGSFSVISRHNKTNHQKFYYRVQAHQTTREPLDQLVKIFGGKIYLRERQSKVFADGYKRKDIFVWDVNGEAARKCMIAALPFLSKRRKDQIGIAFDLMAQGS